MTVTSVPPPLSTLDRAGHLLRHSRSTSIRPRQTSLAASLLSAARPHQWVKNVAVLMVPGLLLLTIGLGGVAAALFATLAFCLAASSVYLLNDTVDRNQDRLHPTKRNRPIASGLIRPAEAIAASGTLAVTAVVLGAMVTPGVGAVVATYLFLTGAYSLRLKRIAYLDVAVLALGFVLRVLAGAVAVHAAAPPLLLAAVFAGAGFLAFGKRRAELMLLGDDASSHRSSLGHYDLQSLDTVIRGAEIATVVAFALWIFVTTGSHLGMALGVVAGAGLGQALDAQRRSVRTGRGGNPTRDLLANHALLPGLALAGAAALTAGLIR